jgi:hypothetical protein
MNFANRGSAVPLYIDEDRYFAKAGEDVVEITQRKTVDSNNLISITNIIETGILHRINDIRHLHAESGDLAEQLLDGDASVVRDMFLNTSIIRKHVDVLHEAGGVSPRASITNTAHTTTTARRLPYGKVCRVGKSLVVCYRNDEWLMCDGETPSTDEVADFNLPENIESTMTTQDSSVLVDITLSDETRSSLEKLIKQWY